MKYRISLLLALAVQGIWAESTPPQTVEAPPQVRLNATLQDPFFGSDSVEMVLLETGASLKLRGGESFKLDLPLDTVWNLCALSASKERCYLIRRGDTSLVLQGVLLNSQNSVFYSESYLNELENKYAQAPAPNGIKDSAYLASLGQGESKEDEQSLEGATKLRKVVLNIKKRPKRSLGQSTISAKNIKRMPSLAEADVVKAIQAMPGVVASSDFSSKIYVRGGGADQNLFLFDKAVVFSPVHFFGLFSTFLVEGVDKVDFYKGGFSPSFGNRLSSVLDVQTKKGGLADSLSSDSTWKWNLKEIGQEAAALGSAVVQPFAFYDFCYNFKCADRPKDEFGGSFLLSTFASTLFLNGKNGPVRFQLAGRSTYLKEMLGLFRAAGITDLDLDYRFYDVQGALDYKSPGGDEWKLSVYQGHDDLIFSPINLNWGNTVIPLNYKRKVNEDQSVGATLSYSAFDQLFDLQDIQAFKNEIQTWMFKPYSQTKLRTNDELNLGAELQYNTAKFINEPKLLNDPTDTTRKKIIFEDGGPFVLLSPFAEYKWRPEGSWEYALGARTNYEWPLNHFSLEPRLSATWKPLPRQKVDLHLGYYEQFINSILFSNFESVNEFYYPSVKTKYNQIKPSNSVLLSAGWSHEELFPGIETTFEGFYKTLNHLISFQPNAVSSEVSGDPDLKLGDLLGEAQGYSYGLEASMRKNEGHWTGGLSYSYGRSILNEAGQVFPANWDKSHALKWDAAINWFGEDGIWSYARPRPGRYFRSSTQLTWTTGLPRTSIMGYMPSHLPDQGLGQEPGGPNVSFGDNLSLPYSSRNGDRYPNYFRWDIKLVDWGVEGEWNFSWSLINVSGHENVFLYNYDKTQNPPKLNAITQFPFLPVFFSFQRYF